MLKLLLIQTVPAHHYHFLQHLLKVKKVWVSDLYSKKKDKYFGAFIVLEKNGNFYNLQLSFPKTKLKTIDEKFVFDSFNTRGDEEYHESTTTEKNDTKYINLEEKKIQQLEIEKLKSEKRLLQEKAHKDQLTRAYNRHKFDEDIKEIEAQGILKNISIAFIDGDKFKSINDIYGHQVGDDVLVLITNCIFDVIRNKSINLYRYGGEEFILISLEKEKNTIEIVELIRKKVSESFIENNNKKICITISAGVAFGKNHNNMTSLVEKADILVYSAKENGRNRIEIENDNKSDQQEIEELQW